MAVCDDVVHSSTGTARAVDGYRIVSILRDAARMELRKALPISGGHILDLRLLGSGGGSTRNDRWSGLHAAGVSWNTSDRATGDRCARSSIGGLGRLVDREATPEAWTEYWK